MRTSHLFIWCLLSVFSLLMPHGLFAQDVQYEEIIVNFEDDATREEIESIAKEYGIELTYNSIFSKPEVLLRFPVGERKSTTLQDLMNALTAEADIEYAEPNYLYHAMLSPNDPLYEKQWNMQMINMEAAWDVTTGEDAIVAVIDTGVAYEDYKDRKGVYHRVPDLAKTKFVQGYDFIDDDEHANDDNAHGTHVAGTIAQSTNNKEGVTGIAYRAAIMPLKVLSREGYGSTTDVAEAVIYAADHGAHVINMSLGGGGETKYMREAIEYAHEKGITIICAAGNEGRNRASYPAAYPYSIGVASVGPDGKLAPYSNYGEGVDLAAPGGNTRTSKDHGILQNTIGRMDPTKDSYEAFQGTSMAAPHVAGVAALIVSMGVTDPDRVGEILLSTAVDQGDKVKYGAGILNAAAAVTSATPEAPVQVKESLIYFLSGIGFAIFYFKLLKREDRYGKLFSFLFFLASFLSSSGYFFFSSLSVPGVPHSVMNALASPLPNLDRVVLGYSSALLNPLLHSAIIPVLLIILFLNSKTFRVFAIGLAVGMAAHLFVDTFFSLGNVTYIPGSFWLDKAWLFVNGLICFGVALLAGKKS